MANFFKTWAAILTLTPPALIGAVAMSKAARKRKRQQYELRAKEQYELQIQKLRAKVEKDLQKATEDHLKKVKQLEEQQLNLQQEGEWLETYKQELTKKNKKKLDDLLSIQDLLSKREKKPPTLQETVFKSELEEDTAEEDVKPPITLDLEEDEEGDVKPPKTAKPPKTVKEEKSGGVKPLTIVDHPKSEENVTPQETDFKVDTIIYDDLTMDSRPPPYDDLAGNKKN